MWNISVKKNKLQYNTKGKPTERITGKLQNYYGITTESYKNNLIARQAVTKGTLL